MGRNRSAGFGQLGGEGPDSSGSTSSVSPGIRLASSGDSRAWAGRKRQATNAPTSAIAAVTSAARDIAYTNASRAASASA